MSTTPISAGQEVTYQGEPYVVRSIDGNVFALEYHTGGFFRFVHASSVTSCTPSATQTAASLDAPAAGQGEGTLRDAVVCWCIVVLLAIPALVVSISLAYSAFVIATRVADAIWVAP